MHKHRIDYCVCGYLLLPVMFCTVFFSQSIFRLSFPSVFVVYQTIPFMVIAILVLVGYIDKAALFCREPELGLVANIYNPSPFCLISGVGRAT